MCYPFTLGGVTFDAPSLPWRLVQELQPGLLSWVGGREFGENEKGFLRLKSSDLAALSDLVFRAVQLSPQGKAMTREAFDELPIATLEMAAAINPILRACGLKFDAPGEGADPKA